jgi:hypothetical protein
VPKGVNDFSIHTSIGKLAIHGFSKAGILSGWRKSSHVKWHVKEEGVIDLVILSGWETKF